MRTKMPIEWGKEHEYQGDLKRGLDVLGPDFVARICFWCDGMTKKDFAPCDVCGKGRIYFCSTGLLIGNEPAPDSVVNQVLEAAKRSV
jgi:hypothetical protein